MPVRFFYNHLTPRMDGGGNIAAVMQLGDDRWALINGKSFWSRIPAIRSRLMEVGPEALEIEESNLPDIAPIVPYFVPHYDYHDLHLYFLEHDNKIYYIYHEGYGKFVHDETSPLPDICFTLMAHDGPMLTPIDWATAEFLHGKVRPSHVLFPIHVVHFIICIKFIIPFILHSLCCACPFV